MSLELPPKLKGFKNIRRVVSAVRAFAISIRLVKLEGYDLTSTPTGTLAKRANQPQIVTGCVNGVPSTLAVMADGQWKKIT